jgi:hypothetical protein
MSDRYDRQYAADMQHFACVDVVERELRTAIEENGYSFDGWTDEQVAQDLHRYSPAAEVWPYELVLEAVPIARRNINN